MTERRLLLAAAAGSRLHWSWLPALAALNWVLVADHFPRLGLDATAAAAAGVTVLCVVCVAIHEGVRRIAQATAGGGIEPVTLWPTGGLTQSGKPRPIRADIRAAVAGPLSSLALAAAFSTVNAEGAPGAAIDVLVRFNIAYGTFSLVPAAPLDGGILLRSALRARGRSSAEASATAARAGLVFAGLLVVTGAARAASGDRPGGIGLAVAGAITAAAARTQAPAAPPRARLTLRAALASAPLVLVMLVALAALYHPPLALAAPGTPLDVAADVEIVGRPAARVNGRYVAASVRVQDPTALHAFVSLFRRDHYLVRRSTLRPSVDDPFKPAGDPEGLFGISRDYAAVAAARAVGIPVELHGTGVRVFSAGAGARAAGFMPGDTIVGVDGGPIDRLDQLREVVVARPAGASFALTVERGGRRSVRSIRSVREVTSGLPYLDMLGETRDFRYVLPFEIRFRTAGELGPSAGLAYAIAIADLLDPRDLAQGRTIAATGRVDVTGLIDPIIGAIAKQWSALDARAALFVVAEEDANALRQPVVPVMGVNTVRDAVQRLAG